jgi:hypothetical protein
MHDGQRRLRRVHEAQDRRCEVNHNAIPRDVCPIIGTFVAHLQEYSPVWRIGIEPLLPRLTGSRGSASLAHRRRWFIVDWMLRTVVPARLERSATSAQDRTLAAIFRGSASEFATLVPIVNEATCRAAEELAETIYTENRGSWNSPSSAAGDALSYAHQANRRWRDSSPSDWANGDYRAHHVDGASVLGLQLCIVEIGKVDPIPVVTALLELVERRMSRARCLHNSSALSVGCIECCDVVSGPEPLC